MDATLRQALAAALFIGAVSTGAQARQHYDTIGMATYKKLCKSCHGSAYKGAAMHTKKAWERYFASGAKKLIASHDGVPECKEMFVSSFSKNRSGHLERFLSKNGSDSGVVPGCDGNYCR